MTPNKEDYPKCIYEIGSRHKKSPIKKSPSSCRFHLQLWRKWWKNWRKNFWSRDKKPATCWLIWGLRLVSGPLPPSTGWIEVFLVNHLGYSTDEIHEGSRSPRAYCFWALRWASRCHAPVLKTLSSRALSHQRVTSGRRKPTDSGRGLCLATISSNGCMTTLTCSNAWKNHNLQIGQTITFINTILSLRPIFLRQKLKIQINPGCLEFMWKTINRTQFGLLV